MRHMTEQEWQAFVMEGTRTGKVATARKDGRPHVVPVWFVLDRADIAFTTSATSVKGQALRRDRLHMHEDDLGAPGVEGNMQALHRPSLWPQSA